MRSRWVGPGMVVLQRGGTVWVAMRSRLWKCSADQVRPASADEEAATALLQDPTFQELWKQANNNANTGAVDVHREGPPPEEAWSREALGEAGPVEFPAPSEPTTFPAPPRDVRQDAASHQEASEESTLDPPTSPAGSGEGSSDSVGSTLSRRRPWERDMRQPALPSIEEETEGGESDAAAPEKRHRIIVDEAPNGMLPRIWDRGQPLRRPRTSRCRPGG